MGTLTAPLVGLGALATSHMGVFLPALIAAIAYFQYDLMDPESRPIDTDTELLHDSYDFIIVGAGSAGNLNNILTICTGCGTVTC